MRNHFLNEQGWGDERLVGTASNNGGRVVLVLDGDPRPRWNKVCNHLRVKDLGIASTNLI